MLRALALLLLLAPQDSPQDRCEALLPGVAALDPGVRSAAHAAMLKLAGEAKEALRKSEAGPVTLALAGDASVRAEIVKLLASERPELARAAAEAAGTIVADGAAKELSKLLDSDDLLLALAAARSLGKAKAAPVRAALQAVAELPEMPRRKVLAAYGLASSGSAEAIVTILAQADNAAAAAPVREAAWAALVNLPQAAAEIRKRIDQQHPVPGEALKKLFLEQPPAGDLRPLFAKLLLAAGSWGYAEVAALVDHRSPEVAAWARKAVLDPALHRRSILVTLLLERLAAFEKEPDETKEPIPSLELLLQSQGLRGEGPTLKDRMEAYRRAWEAVRVTAIDADVNKAIDAGVARLREKQEPDGSWKYCHCGLSPSDDHAKGSTALAVYTLLKCEVPLKDKAVLSGLEFILSIPVERRPHTYTVGLEAMVFSEAYEQLFKAVKAAKSKAAQAAEGPKLAAWWKRLHECAEWLVEAQTRKNRGGYESGDWGYDQVGTGADNSNTQFGMLGLRAARNAGVPVPERAWAKALNHWQFDQTKDGGWPYRREKEQPNQGGTRSMSAAGMYSWLVAQASLQKKAPETLVGQEPVKKVLGYFKKAPPIPAPRAERPGGHGHGVYYDLYSLERAMMIAKLDRLNDRPWYHDGSLYIIFNQGHEGGWIDTSDTCFALLFLKKAYVAVATGDNR